MGTPYDNLDIEGKKAVYANAKGVIREVDMGSTYYTADQHQHAQDTINELKPVIVDDYLSSVRQAGLTMEGSSLDELNELARG